MVGLLYRRLLYRLKYRQNRAGSCHRSFHGKIKTPNSSPELYFVLSPIYNYMLHLCIMFKYILSLAHNFHLLIMLIFQTCYFQGPMPIHDVYRNLTNLYSSLFIEILAIKIFIQVNTWLKQIFLFVMSLAIVRWHAKPT